MKFGFRKPSIKKSIKARTTGKIKRKMKKAFNPFYRFVTKICEFVHKYTVFTSLFR